jgi:hypothetical protein
MERVETNMKELEDNLSTYNGTMDRFYTQALTKIETIKGLITTIRSDIEQYQRIQKEYNDSQARVQALQSQIEGLERDIQRLQKANQDLREEHNADQQLRNQLEKLQEELRSLREEQVNLQEQLGIATVANEDKDKLIEDYGRQIKAKDDEIAQKQSEIDEKQRRIDVLIDELRNAQRAIEDERGRERGLEGQLEAYGDRIVELNTLLLQLSGDPRAEEVQNGLDDIIGQLRGLTNNSGGDDPGPGPAPAPAPGGYVPPDRSNRSSSSSAHGPDSGSTPTPGSNSDSRPGTADSESSEFQIGSTLERLGDTTRTSEERADPVDGDDIPSSTSEEQQRKLAPGEKLPELKKIQGKYRQTKGGEEVDVHFLLPGSNEDKNARNNKIKKLIQNHFGSNSDSIFKGNDGIMIRDTIVGRATPYLDKKEHIKIRNNIRNDLNKWQNEEYKDAMGELVFKDVYTTAKKGEPDNFQIEFPRHGSQMYRPNSTFGTGHDNKSKRSGRRGGKKTRRKQGGKSKNKTIRYKRRKNRKQSKK